MIRKIVCYVDKKELRNSKHKIYGIFYLLNYFDVSIAKVKKINPLNFQILQATSPHTFIFLSFQKSLIIFP
jgi:hypothetical protein